MFGNGMPLLRRAVVVAAVAVVEIVVAHGAVLPGVVGSATVGAQMAMGFLMVIRQDEAAGVIGAAKHGATTRGTAALFALAAQPGAVKVEHVVVQPGVARRGPLRPHGLRYAPADRLNCLV